MHQARFSHMGLACIDPHIIKETTYMEPDPEPLNKVNQTDLSKVGQLNSSLPTDLEKKHVYQVYDKIAPHFSHTRYKPWPKIEAFLNTLDPGSLVCDVGCGNGKYLGVNNSLHMVGTDRSLGLLKTAQEKSENYQLFAADSLLLPVRSQSFDAFISIAVIHHFSNDAQRHRALSELTRILKVGGVGLVYVWALEQDLQGQGVGKRKFKEQDVFVPWHLHFKYESDLENIDHEGCEIDMAKKSVVYQRYYHVFRKGELENLIEQHPNLKVVNSYYDKENWCVQIQRIQ